MGDSLNTTHKRSEWVVRPEDGSDIESICRMKLEANPLQWDSPSGTQMPADGVELPSEKLRTALVEKYEAAEKLGGTPPFPLSFTKEEWDSLDLSEEVRSTSFVKVRHAYYRPASAYKLGDWAAKRAKIKVGRFVECAAAKGSKAVERFEALTSGKDSFGIRHFGGAVFYRVQDFCEKNLDKLDTNLAELLGKGTGEKDPISKKFIKSMKDLDDRLRRCHGHFVRCIKPNNEPVKEARAFAFWEQVRSCADIAQITCTCTCTCTPCPTVLTEFACVCVCCVRARACRDADDAQAAADVRHRLRGARCAGGLPDSAHLRLPRRLPPWVRHQRRHACRLARFDRRGCSAEARARRHGQVCDGQVPAARADGRPAARQEEGRTGGHGEQEGGGRRRGLLPNR